MLNKLSLSVGLVNIPVRLENAVGKGTKPSGKYVCAESGKPLNGGSGGSAQTCGQRHEDPCRRAIGYPRANGSFYVPGEDDLDKLNGDKDRLIKLDDFVDAESVDPIYFDATYVLKPEKGQEANFWAIAEGLKEYDQIAVGRATLDKDEKMLFLRWSKEFDCLVLSTGCYHEQIALDAISAAQATRPNIEYPKALMVMVHQMMTAFAGPFDPLKYQPTRWHGLRDLIVTNGASPTGEAAAPTGETEPTTDMMALLKASIETKVGPKKPRPRKPAAKKTARKKVA